MRRRVDSSACVLSFYIFLSRVINFFNFIIFFIIISILDVSC